MATDKYDEAAAAYQRSLMLSREGADPDLEGRSLRNPWKSCRPLATVRAKAMALDSLGITLSEAGQYGEAIMAHTNGRAICRDLGDRAGTAFAEIGDAKNTARVRDRIELLISEN